MGSASRRSLERVAIHSRSSELLGSRPAARRGAAGQVQSSLAASIIATTTALRLTRFTISWGLRSCLRQQPGRERNADIPSELQDCGRTGSSMRIQIRLRPILVWAIGLMVAGAIAWWIAMRFLVLTD